MPCCGVPSTKGPRMYNRSAVPYGPASCRSMKTAHPASFPPGVCGSGGISRSTSASMAVPSYGVKYTQGPGCTGVGGLPAFGDQGKLPFKSNAAAEVVENMSVIAVVNSSSRRLTPREDCDFVSSRIRSATMAFLDAAQRIPGWRSEHEIARYQWICIVRVTPI